MTIEEAIANNIGSVITGSVAILSSCITTGVAVWVSNVNHNRTLEKEKKVVLVSKLENTLKEAIRWRNGISLYMLYIKYNLMQGHARLSVANNLLDNHQISLNDININTITLYVKLCVNDEVIKCYEILYENHNTLNDFVINYSMDSSVEVLENISMNLMVSIG